MVFWGKNKNKNTAAAKAAKSLPSAATKNTRAIRVSPFFKVAISSCQHIGARDQQEDTLAFTDFSDQAFVQANGFVALVADGMGGLDCGEEASRAAAAAFLHIYQNREPSESTSQTLKRALLVANATVFDLAFDGYRELDLGTTLVAAALFKDELHFISAGDSRLYLYRKNELFRLTTDHIYANHLELEVLNGRLSREEALEHPEKDYLTSYLGLPDLSEICQSEEPFSLLPGDRVLLASDGLTGTLSEEEICAVLEKGACRPAEEMVKEVLVTNKPYQDNVTVIILSILPL